MTFGYPLSNPVSQSSPVPVSAGSANLFTASLSPGQTFQYSSLNPSILTQLWIISGLESDGLIQLFIQSTVLDQGQFLEGSRISQIMLGHRINPSVQVGFFNNSNYQVWLKLEGFEIA